MFPQVPIQRVTLAVSGSSVWSCIGPKSFLQGPCPSRDMVPPQGNSATGVSGRLAFVGTRRQGSGSGDKEGLQHADEARVASFDGEVTDDSVTNIPIHWGNLCPTEQQGEAVSVKDCQLVSAGGSFEQSAVHVSQRPYGGPGSFGFHDRDCTYDQTVHEGSSDVPPATMESEAGPVVNRHPARPVGNPEPTVVGGPGQLVGRRPNLGATDGDLSVHRCITDGLGSPLGGPDIKWAMVQSRKRSYQCARDESCNSGGVPLGPPVAEQEGTGSIRQCLHSAIYQPSGRDDLPQTVSSGSKSMADSGGQWHLAECSTYKGRDKCDCGFTIKGPESSLVGVVSLSQGSVSDFPSVRDSANRPVCIEAQPQVGNVLQLGQGSGSLCYRFPSASSGTACGGMRIRQSPWFHECCRR